MWQLKEQQQVIERRKPLESRACEQCGKTFYGNHTEIRRNRFCGPECKTNWREDRQAIRKRFCINCGEFFIANHSQIKNNTAKYCSRKCHGETMSSERRRDGNPAWRGNDVGYFGIHLWLRNNFEYPKHCENCGQDKKLDWALMDGKDYERKRENFMALCRGCHLAMEYANGTRRSGGYKTNCG